MNQRPGWLTAVCVLGIVLGCLSIFLAIVSVGVVLFQEQTQQFAMSLQSMGQPNQSPELKKVQEEMYAELSVVQKKWQFISIALQIALVALGGLFLYGGVKTLSLSPLGRTVLLAAFCMAAVYEVVRLWPQIAIQRETSAVTTQYTNRIFDLTLQQQAKGKPVPPQAKQIMQTATEVGMIVGVAFVVGWSLLKLVVYGVAIWYLLRAPIRALFANESGPAMVAPV